MRGCTIRKPSGLKKDLLFFSTMAGAVPDPFFHSHRVRGPSAGGRSSGQGPDRPKVDNTERAPARNHQAPEPRTWLIEILDGRLQGPPGQCGQQPAGQDGAGQGICPGRRLALVTINLDGGQDLLGQRHQPLPGQHRALSAALVRPFAGRLRRLDRGQGPAFLSLCRTHDLEAADPGLSQRL